MMRDGDWYWVRTPSGEERIAQRVDYADPGKGMAGRHWEYEGKMCPPAHLQPEPIERIPTAGQLRKLREVLCEALGFGTPEPESEAAAEGLRCVMNGCPMPAHSRAALRKTALWSMLVQAGAVDP